MVPWLPIGLSAALNKLLKPTLLNVDSFVHSSEHSSYPMNVTKSPKVILNKHVCVHTHT